MWAYTMVVRYIFTLIFSIDIQTRALNNIIGNANFKLNFHLQNYIFKLLIIF